MLLSLLHLQHMFMRLHRLWYSICEQNKETLHFEAQSVIRVNKYVILEKFKLLLGDMSMHALVFCFLICFLLTR